MIEITYPTKTKTKAKRKMKHRNGYLDLCASVHFQQYFHHGPKTKNKAIQACHVFDKEKSNIIESITEIINATVENSKGLTIVTQRPPRAYLQRTGLN